MLRFFQELSPCLVGLEACATAHYWARELTKLGHEVRLMPARDVKAYVKRNKNDAADAEAICEAVRRPTMRFVRVKSAEQQAQLMQHRARDLLLRQRTQLINAMRAHMAELGIAAPQGREGIKQLLAIIANDEDARLPVDARASLIVLAVQLEAMHTMIGSLERRIVARHRSSPDSQRLQTIPGVGVIGAIGWRGLQFVLARDYTHVMEGVIGLGVGGGMIAGARPLGTALVGTAAAFGGPLAGLTLGMAVGDVLALADVAVMAVGYVMWSRRGRRD